MEEIRRRNIEVPTIFMYSDIEILSLKIYIMLYSHKYYIILQYLNHNFIIITALSPAVFCETEGRPKLQSGQIAVGNFRTGRHPCV
jgi:hypothetical protein